MTDGPICRHCGQYLAALDDHDERQCEIDTRIETYRRGAAAARQALHTARATTPQEDT